VVPVEALGFHGLRTHGLTSTILHGKTKHTVLDEATMTSILVSVAEVQPSS